MKPETFARLDDLVDERFDDSVAFLRELVRVPTDTPPGDNAAGAERAAALLEELGFVVERHAVPADLVRARGMVSVTNLVVRVRFGAGPVVAADIAESADVEIVNPDQLLMTIDKDDVTIELDLTVERGVGYIGAERAEALPIGVIAVDAIFTPVRKVNYWIDSVRVGQDTNHDKLTIEIETDGTISPEEALSRAAGRLVDEFQHFVAVGMPALAVVGAAGGAPALPPNMLDMPIEELDLPMRAYNSLKRNNIVKVGQLLQLSDDDLLRMRNFGKKSLDEMKERLRMRGFIVPEAESDELDGLEAEEPFEDESEES